MSILHHATPVVQPVPLRLVPPELVDPFADDDDWGLSGVEAGSPMFGPDDAPGLPTLPFAEWIELQASAIRSHGTDAAGWLAGRLDELAVLARYFQAQTPSDFDAREELAEADLMAQAFDAGADSPR